MAGFRSVAGLDSFCGVPATGFEGVGAGALRGVADAVSVVGGDVSGPAAGDVPAVAPLSETADVRSSFCPSSARVMPPAVRTTAAATATAVIFLRFPRFAGAVGGVGVAGSAAGGGAAGRALGSGLLVGAMKATAPTSDARCPS